MTDDDDDEPVDLLDALFEVLAQYAADHGTPTEKDRAWAKRLQRLTLARLAQYRSLVRPRACANHNISTSSDPGERPIRPSRRWKKV